ncbi:MAG: nucleoside-diphosphate sugar epimerase/dehydratase [Candidatus Sericytochromatia bacterium]|nr:nucleoside-diphosphate sugar epimerase/dehydratase [Candidatus Sericytochromatia bacterium]
MTLTRLTTWLATTLTPPRLLQAALDLSVAAAAWYGAYLVRFDGLIPAGYRAQMAGLLPLVLGLWLVARLPFGVHHQLWRFVSLREARDIVLATSAVTGTLFVLGHAALATRIPWGILALDWGMCLLGVVALRAIRRTLAEWQPRAHGARKRVLLVGAGEAGRMIARDVQRQRTLEAVGFLDDDPVKHGSRLQGLPILGAVRDLSTLGPRLGVDEVLLCVPSATREEMRAILEACRQAHLPARTLPSVRDLIAGTVELQALRSVQIEDLLNRDPVTLDHAVAGPYISGKTVLVTGGGGSIGSELCRQLARLGPARLLVLGKGEHSVYLIDQELRQRLPGLEVVPLVGDVRDEGSMRHLFERHRPEVVFHAAAHKHVPLMERQPAEAVLNNVGGTRTVAELAHAHQVETFVLISTDKAVNPTNVMGATKRVAELIVSELASRSRTRFMAVRFGNVLDSRGSVIPLFKQQIAAGGPVTVTHPDITRFFMTIPEASQLVIQAGALGQGGEVFVLDMGEPVRIADLARDLIRLSGLEPDVDVKLRYTGLRPGEKLYEELLTAEEGVQATRHEKIHVARPEVLSHEALEAGLARLMAAASSADPRRVREALRALVATYREPAEALAQDPT